MLIPMLFLFQLLFLIPTSFAQGIPIAPTGLTATAVSPNQINVAWTDTNSTESGYEVYRQPLLTTSWTKIATTGPSATTWADPGLTPGSTFAYRVRAYTIQGTYKYYSSYSTVARATTPLGGGTVISPPAAGAVTPSNTAFGNFVDGTFDVSTPFSSSTTVTGCEYTINGGASWAAAAVSGASPNFTCSKTGITGANGQALGLNMRATSSAGIGTATAVSRVVDVAPPTTGALAAATGSGQVTLSWPAATDAGSGLSTTVPYKLVFGTGGFPASCSSGTVLLNGTGTSFVHTGLVNGTTYYYRLCATDAVGNVAAGATASARPAGTTNQPPVANAGASQSTQTLIAISFNGSASYDPDGTIASYAWNFGDGATASGVTASHAYAAAGTYTVTLTVTDNLGAVGSATTSVTALNRAPVANAGPDQTVQVNTTVTRNGSGSSDADGSIAAYAWNFGDGGTGSGVTASHVYTAAGTYTVTLTVTDNKGATATDQALITVSGAAAGGGAFQWAKRFGSSGTSSVVGYSTAVDSAGNIIVAGTFSGTVNFGGGSLTSAGGSADIFVAKFTSAGVHVWSKRFGDALDDAAYAVAVDASNNIVIGGYFKRTLNFGGSSLVAFYNGVPPETQDGFVAKLTSSGSEIWSRRFGSWSSDLINGVAVDASGNVFAVGTFLGNVDFGGKVLSGTTPDIVLAKYAAATGQLVWARGFGNTGVDSGNGVAVDANGNVIMTALFRYGVDFGGGSIVGGGSADIVLAKYSNDGVQMWSKAIGGTSNDDSSAVSVDASGNVFLTGYVAGTVDFGGGPTPSIGSWDMYVAKYSPTGAYQWAKRLGGAYQDQGLGIAADANGNVLVSGAFMGSGDFGTGAVASAGGWDMVVSKYSPSGTALWSKRFGSTGDDYAYAIASDQSGNAVVTGAFRLTVDFGGGPLTATGWSDMFVLKLAP